MEFVKPIDPVATVHLLQDNPDIAVYYASSMINSTKFEDFKENYWFPTPEDLGDAQHYTPIRIHILTDLLNLQELVKFNPQDNHKSRKQLLANFDWTDSMLQQDNVACIEDLLVEFHDIFARNRCDIGKNEDFKGKLTPEDDYPA